jgi:predicted protein tyrosine phosphatase
MRVLFICNQNKHRSKTAEELFSKQFETKSAGLYLQTPVTEKQVQWADLIVVMEDTQRTELSKRFPTLYLKKRIVSIDVPDVYRYQQKELQTMLQEKMSAIV